MDFVPAFTISAILLVFTIAKTPSTRKQLQQHQQRTGRIGRQGTQSSMTSTYANRRETWSNLSREQQAEEMRVSQFFGSCRWNLHAEFSDRKKVGIAIGQSERQRAVEG